MKWKIIIGIIVLVFLLFGVGSFLLFYSIKGHKIVRKNPVKKDKTPPTITKIYSNRADGTIKNGEVIDIRVAFSEEVSSEGNIVLSLTAGPNSRACSFTIVNSKEGICNYTVQAGDNVQDFDVLSVSGVIKDKAGNVLKNFTPAITFANSKKIIVDTMPPVTTLTANPAEPNGNDGWYGQQKPTIILSAADPVSGIANIYYKWDNSSYAPYTQTLTALEGQHTIYFYAEDKVGNKEAEKSQLFKVDTTPSNTTIDLTPTTP